MDANSIPFQICTNANKLLFANLRWVRSRGLNWCHCCIFANPLALCLPQQDPTYPVINRWLFVELFSHDKCACANHRACWCWEEPLNGCCQQEGMAPGLSWVPCSLKFRSAPLGSDSGEKSALPMTQQGEGEVLQQQGKNLSVKGLVDH